MTGVGRTLPLEITMTQEVRMICKHKETIAVDVDLTVVDTLDSWVKWFEERSPDSFDWSKLRDMDAKTIMGQSITDPMKFWFQTDLYDKLTPEPDCRTVLESLSRDYNIIFVTSSKPEHIRSKEAFINKWFKFHDGIVHTENKELIQADYFIDDYDHVANSVMAINDHARVLFKRTRLNQYQTVKGSHSVCNWRDIDVYFTGSVDWSW